MDNSNNSNINDSTNDNDNTNVNENGFVEIQQNHKIPNKTNNFLHGPRRNDGERQKNLWENAEIMDFLGMKTVESFIKEEILGVGEEVVVLDQSVIVRGGGF